MNLLINFSTLKEGGGQNVALNFLSVFNKVTQNDRNNYYFFVAEKSLIYEFIVNDSDFDNKYAVCPYSPEKRIVFELFKSRKYLRKWNIDLIYSYFGYGMYRTNIPQVIGEVDSNLFYPEIDFWSGYGLVKRMKLFLVDRYRIYGLLHSTAVIFENEALEKRFHQLFKSQKPTITIKPSISLNYAKSKFVFDGGRGVPKGLFLCGWHLNKNVLLIPEIAYELKQRKIPFQFIITAPNDDSQIHIEFQRKVKSFNVDEYINVVGQVRKDKLFSLYEKIDIVFLLSLLESFSNNIIEAWSYKKPLLISDAEWAHAICNDAAIYVDRNNPSAIAECIMRILSDDIYVKQILENGIKQCEFYPTVTEKAIQEMNFITEVYEKVLA